VSRGRTLVLTAALVVGASLLASCGVDTGGSADRAPSENVPFGLLEPEPRAASGNTGRPATIYLYDSASGRLQAVVVNLPSTFVKDVLVALQEPPADDAASDNPLGDADVIRSVSSSRGVVTVDLSEAFSELSSTSQLIALAEIVYTATARPGVGQVAFTQEGQPIAVPKGDGSLEDDPVTRSDYPDLDPDLDPDATPA
jgi:hypothetical protein